MCNNVTSSLEELASTSAYLENIFFPQEIKDEIFEYLFPGNLNALACTNLHFRRLCDQKRIKLINIHRTPIHKLELRIALIQRLILRSNAKLKYLEISVISFKELYPLLQECFFIKYLKIKNTTFLDEEVKELLGCDTLQNLKSLNLSSNKIYIHDLNQESIRRAFPKLVHLNLDKNKINAFGLEKLNACLYLSNLTSLRLSHNPIRDSGALKIGNANLNRLKFLCLNKCKISSIGIEYLFSNGQGACITHLSICNNSIDDQGFRLLMKYTSNLEVLNLSGNQINGQGIKSFMTSPNFNENYLSKIWPSIKSLNLSDNSIGDAGAQLLFYPSFLENLTHLNISKNGIGDIGGSYMFLSPRLSLNYLNVSFNALSPLTIVKKLKRIYKKALLTEL